MYNLPSPSAVSALYIFSECVEGDQLYHECIFSLSNRQDYIEISLPHNEIEKYINQLPNEKLNCHLPRNHFETPINNYNENNNDININEIDSFDISSECQETMPCKHLCTIKLKDRTIQKTLNRIEITKYIRQLPITNISGSLRLDHFSSDLYT